MYRTCKSARRGQCPTMGSRSRRSVDCQHHTSVALMIRVRALCTKEAVVSNPPLRTPANQKHTKVAFAVDAVHLCQRRRSHVSGPSAADRGRVGRGVEVGWGEVVVAIIEAAVVAKHCPFAGIEPRIHQRTQPERQGIQRAGISATSNPPDRPSLKREGKPRGEGAGVQRIGVAGSTPS